MSEAGVLFQAVDAAFRQELPPEAAEGEEVEGLLLAAWEEGAEEEEAWPLIFEVGGVVEGMFRCAECWRVRVVLVEDCALVSRVLDNGPIDARGRRRVGKPSMIFVGDSKREKDPRIRPFDGCLLVSSCVGRRSAVGLCSALGADDRRVVGRRRAGRVSSSWYECCRPSARAKVSSSSGESGADRLTQCARSYSQHCEMLDLETDIVGNRSQPT